MKEDIDLVIIATPNQWHKKYAIAAMKAGKNVVIEKPVVMNVAEMEELIKCQKETGKLCTVHQQRRHDSDYQVLKEIISSGKIGNITTIESTVAGERGVCFGWRADPESGGGMLYDWGVHLIDQILQLFEGQRVQYVNARLMSILTPAVDDYVDLILGFDKGVEAKIKITTFALEKIPRWYVYGDRGTLKLQDFSGIIGSAKRIKKEVAGFDSVLGKQDLGPSRTMAPLAPESVENIELSLPKDETFCYWENLLTALEKKVEPEVKLGEILRVMQVVETAFKSSKEKQIFKTLI